MKGWKTVIEIADNWKGWAFVWAIFCLQALIWISFGALLAHEMCKP